ncbi:MAG TPA: citrate/2-methylcitrate synthase [Actinomycetes bacterium]|nr:citrate/2-methylcitrate synthase [Actinomycetes bacterium]
MAETKKGLEGAVAAQTRISEIDGRNGRLSYAGYDIRDLAEHSTFEEVVHLLHHAELPSARDLAQIRATLAAERRLSPFLVDLITSIAPEMSAMSVLRTAVSAAQAHDPDGKDDSDGANLRKSYRLVAQTPQIVAGYGRLRGGTGALAPGEDLGLAAGFLFALHGQAPDPALAHDLDVVFILYADHTLNASTFAGRVAAATLADMHASVTAAVAALQGPLHGGAIEATRRMLEEIGTPDRAEGYVKDRLARRQKIMGFGHRVYRTWDPRAEVLKVIAERLTKQAGMPHLYEISQRIQEVVLAEKGLYPNVDFYTGGIYSAMGIPTDLFTAMFAIARMAGWTAHIREQYADNRLIRPSSEYIGPGSRAWVPPDRRG